MIYPRLTLTQGALLHLDTSMPTHELTISTNDGTPVLGIEWPWGEHEALVALADMCANLIPYLQLAGYYPTTTSEEDSE